MGPPGMVPAAATQQPAQQPAASAETGQAGDSMAAPVYPSAQGDIPLQPGLAYQPRIVSTGRPPLLPPIPPHMMHPHLMMHMQMSMHRPPGTIPFPPHIIAPGPPIMPVIMPSPAALAEPPPPVEKRVVWEEHLAPNGHKYYHCPTSKESRWVRPAGKTDVVVVAGTNPQQAAGEVLEYETIGNTPWLRITGENGMTYFRNKETNVSRWACPDEILTIVRELDGEIPPPTEEEMQQQQQQVGEAQQDADKKGDGEGEGEAKEPEEGGGENDVGDEKMAGEGGEPPEKEEGEESSDEEESDDEQQLDEEKRRLIEQMKKVEDFKDVLREINITGIPPYDKALPKLMYDSRFTAVSTDQRRIMYDKFIKEIAEEKRRQRTKSKKEVHDKFVELLDEAERRDDIHPSSTVETVALRYQDDHRWKAMDSKTRRTLVQERINVRKKAREERREAARKAFRDMIYEFLQSYVQRETESREKESRRETDVSRVEPPRWQRVKQGLRDDPRYSAVTSATREDIFERVCGEFFRAHGRKRERERERGEGGKDEAGKEDEGDDVDKKRQKLMKGEAESSFRNMLAERVKNPFGKKYADVSSQLANDPRDSSDLLSQQDKERLFDMFEKQCLAERRKLLSLVLQQSTQISPSMTFKEAMDALSVMSDKRFQHMPEQVLTDEYEKWRAMQAKEYQDAFRQYLKSCTLITHTSKEDGPEFDKLIQQLSQDIRYQRLEGYADERTELIKQRIREVQISHKRVREENIAERLRTAEAKKGDFY